MYNPHIYCPICRQRVKTAHTVRRPGGKMYRCEDCDIIIKIVHRAAFDIIEKGRRATRRRVG